MITTSIRVVGVLELDGMASIGKLELAPIRRALAVVLE